jgi:hypothetical protein
MEEKIRMCFQILEEKHKEDDILLCLWSDFSGRFYYRGEEKGQLFCFDNILNVSAKDVREWNEQKYQKWLGLNNKKTNKI